MEAKTKRRLKWVAVIFGAGALLVGGILIGVAGVFIYQLTDDPFDDRDFDARTWHSFHDNDFPDNPRGQMVYSVRDTLLAPDITRDEVLAALGPADFRQQEDFLSYNLGMWSGWRMDYDTLDIYFDSDGRLSDVQIVQH